MQKKSFLVFAFLFFIAFFISCRKENKNPSWDIDVLTPLVKSSLTINDILPDSVLQQNPDNSLDIVYSTLLYSFSNINIPDTTIDTVYVSFFTAYVDSCDVIIPSINDESRFNVNSVQLKKIIIRSGKMRIDIKNKTRKILDVRYQIPSATLNGNQFDETVSVPAKAGSNPGTIITDFDLSGYVFDLTGQIGNKVNTLITSVGVKVNCNDFSQDTIFPFTDQVSVSNTFMDIVPEYAKGYFGQTLTNIIDTTTLSLFNHIIQGSINLEDIDIDLSIENGIGADARFTINNLKSINTRTGNTPYALTHSIIGSPVNLNRAVDNNGAVTESTYSVSFNPQNSNIKPFIENLPDKLSYQMDVELNPLGNVSGNNDFIYHDKLLKTKFDMRIPLSIIANDLTIADTLGFNMGDDLKNVNYGTLFLYAENGFPFSAEAQLYVMDAGFNITDSLINFPNTLLAPQLDANLVAAGQKHSQLEIPLDRSKLDLLRNSKNLYLKIKFNTQNQPSHVKIYSFYRMDVQIIGGFNYTIGKKD